jgi:hypothetical protein
MATFSIVRELASLERDKGSKRLLLALYSASDDGSQGNERRYIALSEQVRSGPDTEWQSARKGIIVRRGEISNIIAALQSADFDAKPDGKGMTDLEYLEATGYIT